MDARKHLKQSYLLYTNSPICVTLMTETLAAHPEFRYENVLPYALGTAYGKKVTGDQPVLVEHKANGTVCHMIKLERGTPLHLAHSCESGGASLVPVVRGADGQYSAAALATARRDVLRALYRHSQVEVAVINYYLGKPVVLQYTVTLGADTSAATVRHGSVVLGPGATFCFSATSGYNITATSDYRYTSPEIAEATRGMNNSENRRHVEGEPPSDTTVLDQADPLPEGRYNAEGKYNMGILSRPHFEGIPLHTELILHSTTVYLPYYEYDAQGEPDLALGPQQAHHSVFGLQPNDVSTRHVCAM